MLYTNVKGILTVSLNQNTKIQHISFKQVGFHRPVLTLTRAQCHSPLSTSGMPPLFGNSNTHETIYTLFENLAVNPRFADTIFCLLRLKLVLQKLDNTTKLSSPHRQHFRDYSCSSWSLERRKSGAPRVTCLRAVSSQREAHSQKLLELCEGAPNIYFLSKAPRRTRMVS